MKSRRTSNTRSLGAAQQETEPTTSLHDDSPDMEYQNDSRASGALSSGGSTVVGASLNFTNSIVGAGCIGYGGAMARTGGLASVFTVVFFAILTKLSFDLVIELAVGAQQQSFASYEDLGSAAFGATGRFAVMISKGLFAFGCLVAYIVIVKENFAPACRHLFQMDENASSTLSILLDDNLSTTFLLSATVVLPLCLLRDMKPLERFSAIKIGTFLSIVVIVIYLYATTETSSSTEQNTWAERWFVVRSGFFESMGTFIFTFVAHHTVHLIYQSLKPELRNMNEWRKVSSLSIFLAMILCLPVGLFVYMTYWEETTSNLFELYPPSSVIDLTRILLCITMLLTCPMSFFACRELIILSLPRRPSQTPVPADKIITESDSLIPRTDVKDHPRWLLPGEERQLVRAYHILLTLFLWAFTVILALAAPSLGGVLNLVGCVSGTLTAFILPGMFSFRLQGYTHVGALLLVVGGVVGCVGSYFSLVQLIVDSRRS